MQSNNNFIMGLIQIIAWMVIIILITIRGVTFFLTNNDWIWIVNYIGLFIAFSNLLISKCIAVSSANHYLHKKYKPFKGLTIICIVTSFFLGVPIYFLQQTFLKDCVNDIVTLLAIWFSVSLNVWDTILDSIIKRLKK